MIDDAEKRDFIRMPMQCPITMRVGDNGPTDRAELRDLSAGGIRFLSPYAVEQGVRVAVRIAPKNPITPPLDAEVNVLRCEPLADRFEIAAAIASVEPVNNETMDDAMVAV